MSKPINAYVLADCAPEEIVDLLEGLSAATGYKWETKYRISNWGRSSAFSEIKRYASYFEEGWDIFRNRKVYDVVVGWQQFHALIFAFFCQLFRVEKTTYVCVLNYTYKQKSGFAGSLYRRFMKYITQSKYVDLIHVSNKEHGNSCAQQLNIPPDKFIEAPFGIRDLLPKYEDVLTENGYALAIGRSNRDYDWLLSEWESIDYPLTIISDTYEPTHPLPQNVTHLKNVSGESQYPYLAQCSMLIMPMDDPTVCSGDTVLLTGMSFRKKIIVTTPSMLAKTYIQQGNTGLLCQKEHGVLATLVNDEGNGILGNNARAAFLENYSLRSMGEQIGSNIIERI